MTNSNPHTRHDVGVASALQSALDHHAAAGRLAFIADDRKLTYAEFRARVDERSAYCAQIGLKRQELVGIIMNKSTDAVATFVGILLAGATPCFIEPKITVKSLADRLTSVGMRHLVLDDDMIGTYQALDDVNIHPGSDFAASLPAAKCVIRPDDRAMIIFTAGSTGRPKGVVLTHRNLMTNARGIITHTDLTSRDRLLHLMPLHHTNGVNNQLIAPLIAGATIVLERRFRPDTAVDAMRRQHPTYVTGVPTMYSRMLNVLRPGDRFSSLRFLRCGSAPITLEQHNKIEAAFDVPLILSYGMSEATCTSTMNPVAAPRPGSVGTVLQDQQIRIVAPGTIKPLPTGDDGEICIGGPAVMAGYLGGAPNPIEDGWLHTGDVGHLDNDGYLTITGRLKDIIIRGGENISPAVIEEAMTTHPSVAECCALGAQHNDLGEVPIAFVSLSDSQPRPSESELQNWIQEKLGRIYTPESITVLDALPTTSVGKIDRTKLRTMHLTRAHSGNTSS